MNGPSMSAFPAPASSVTIEIDNKLTDITTMSFSDKLCLTVSQTGSLAHWVHVAMSTGLDTQISTALDSHETETELLPAAHLTATTVLGGTREDDEIFGQTLASTLASSILLKRPDENRLLVLGIGLSNSARLDKKTFDELLGAILPLL